MLPRLVERVWGVNDLRPWYDFAGLERPVGEVWFTGLDNVVEGGATLGDTLAADRAAWLGAPSSPEILLLKFIFTRERLSVQVHPDDDYAARHESSLGKTEAWYILASKPEGRLGLGFVEPLERDRARAAAASGEIERLIDWRRIEPGECYFIPAGVVHAIGAGVSLVEIQENSDITYRLYDYGRPRPLHLERGFEVADLAPYAADGRRRGLGEGREVLVQCGHFTLERWSGVRRLQFTGPAPHYHLVIATSGTGALAGQPLRAGEVFLVPAACDGFEIVGDGMEILIGYSARATSGSWR
jgi:mannose-6-phosphate isomerase